MKVFCFVLVVGLAPPPPVWSGRRLRRRPSSFPSLPAVGLSLGPCSERSPGCSCPSLVCSGPPSPGFLGLCVDSRPTLFCTRVGLSFGPPTTSWSLSLVPHGVPPAPLLTPLGVVWVWLWFLLAVSCDQAWVFSPAPVPPTPPPVGSHLFGSRKCTLLTGVTLL